MDEYDRKFAEMQKYIPFLEAMIDRLQNVKDKSRETQLQKMQSLHGILSNSKRKLKIDTLQRCEDVLQKLHNKVEQGNTPGLHMRGRRSGRRSSRRGNSTDDVNINNSRETDKEKDKTMEETPASPSPPVSPDAVPQCAPIIIPTERNDDFPEDKCDDKGFGPEDTEVLTIKEPIIIPTERQEDKSPINNANEQYPEWNMLEESENALNKLSWQSSSIGNQMVDVAGIVKLVCESLPQKTSESLHAPSHSRHITTIPVPSLGGSRRLTSVLEKSRLSGLNVDLMNDPRSESPAAVSDSRLKSPDSDVVNSRNKITSPMSKDLPTTKPKPPTSLLVSPPPVLTEPPLSMEDLAELLNEGESEKKSNDQGNEKNVQKSDDTLSKKDSKTPKNFVLSHPEIDHDNERRWEEVDKHIVKFSNKKVAPTIISSIVLNAKTTDPKTQISPSTSKSETRFTDNYEKHVKPTDRAPVIQFRGSDEFHEDRSAPLFQRRGAQAINPMEPGGPRMEADFRRETANDYYNWQQMQHPINANEFSKSTWVPPYSGPANTSMPNAPPVHSGQHPMGMHQDMWDMGLNHNAAPENHMMSDPFRSNQFSPNSGIIPLVSPTNRSQDLNQMQNSNIPANNIPLINAPIMSPSHYPVVSQFRNFQENLPYETNFDRSEFSHGRQMWDPSSRVSDIPYRENEGSHNVSCESTSVHPQSNVPSLWGRHYGEQRVRNRESYDRSRNEFRNTFNRDGRRSEWSRDNYEWDNNRFNRDNRNFSDRDPRLRNEHVVPIPPHNQPKENNTNRDPRLAKDKHVPINKSKESKEIKDSKDPKDLKDSKVTKDSADSKDSKEVRNFKDTKESKDSKDSKTGKDSKESKESKDENERDAKKRHFAFKKKPKEFNKLHKNFHKRDFDPKQSNEKSKIDKVLDKEKDRCDEMRSPLESLYGVIDTKAKSVQGSGLQKFKIPKIKRPGPAPSSSVNTTSNEARRKDFKKSDRRNKSKNRFEKNEVIAEVTSTSDSGNVLKANPNTVERWDLDDDIVSSITIENPQKSVDINEPDSISNISAGLENISGEKKDSKESEENKQKEEVTQEWIEALIRKSLQSGEGKKLIEQAQMFRRIGKALKTNKLKKIKKIIESESESSSSEKDVTEAKKLTTKKKRRVIVSDSSEDECLADRLNTLKSLKNKNKIKSSAKNTISSDSANNSVVTENKSVSSMNIDLNSTSTTEASKENETSTKEMSTDKRDESKDDETAENKAALSRSNRAKMKRRNSLEMLQEDVREMFICEDVVNATGHRQCRQVKEPNTNSNLNMVTSTPIAKKKELDLDKSAESIEKSMISTKSKVKTSKSVASDDAKSKAKGKNAKRNTKQKSKDAVTSSDSEEDQPLALRSELLMEDADTSTTENSDLKQNNSDSLRRSKRVQEKEAVKEPRVLLEKTEINKIDSKMMFDSSSDESFGIDVSELAAAVDISLHPEKQTEAESKQAAEAPKKIPQATRKKSRKGKSVTLHEEKVDDNASFTDDASITSDISLSSSNASGKKSIANKSKTNTNEELLSNILVGLVASKQDKNISGDKGSDADIDDDINDALANDSNKKKPSVKKKKKKSSWQMGILSKKKKKKPVTPVESVQTTEVEKTTELTSKEDSASSNNQETEIKTEAESANPNEEQSYIESEKGNNDNVDKIESSMSFFEETEDKKDLHDLTTEENNQNSTESKKANKSPEKKKFVDDIEKLISNMGPKQLMEYAWVGQQKYTCLLCLFVGKNIVHHYKVNHAGKEIMISRLKAPDAELAVNEINVVKNEELLDFETIKLNCRFCLFSLDGKVESTLEAFYEHLTTHTGEYRFRCRSCSYESVARASMKTHYYKVCRKLNQTFADSIFEDPIPKENSVYGYLCTACNFVQLKIDHVQLHLNNWHKDNADVMIVKINMSKNTEITAKSSVSNQNELALSEPSDVKKEEEPQEQENIEIVHQSLEDMETPETKVETVEHKWDPTKTEEQLESCINLKRRMSNNSEPIIRERKQTKRQHKLLTSEAEVSVPSGNINAFVCPPELEHKEVEIQLERKKKMQEIIDNIGIKLQKDASARRLSIIDKLKDKMNNDLAETIEIEEFSATPVASTSAAAESSDDDKKPSSINIEDVKPAAISEILSTASLDQHKLEPSETLEVPPKQEAAESDKTLMEVETELDASDNENVVEAVPNYESDSSSEQSESESTDVNMILKETSNINATSKDPMLTTIQRLAAQLQNVKHEKNSPSSTTEIKKEEVTSPKLTIPKPPSAIPIADIKNLMGAFDNKNQPKNFIRLRRLSGDMLSVPTVADQDDTPSSSCGGSQSDIVGDVLQTDTEEECSFLKIENVVSLAPNATNNETDSPIINDIRKAVETSPTKNMSLLKANSSPVYWKRISPSVVAQAFAKKGLQSIPPVPEAVKLISVSNLSTVTNPQVATNYVPIVPKPNITAVQLDTKKQAIISNAPTITTTGSLSPILSSSLNYKIVKVVKKPSIIKPKENQGGNVAMKLKSSEAYMEMLKPWKLIRLYKCMSRDCSYSSNSVQNFHQHYLNHVVEYEKKNMNPPHDYQKCPYCYMIFENLMQFTTHIQEKHAHCRYQCNYCFYRAIAQSYVKIHQKNNHPGSVVCILTGKNAKAAPIIEIINRRELILPFVCQHECGRSFYVPETFANHLKSHGPQLYTFKCHICEVTFLTGDRLIGHYKMHGMYKYQCLYCLNGSDSIEEIHKHLSLLHCNRLPQILERSLPTKDVGSSDVIDKLLVKNLEELCPPEAVVEIDSELDENESSDIEKALQNFNLLSSTMLNDVSSASTEKISTPTKSLLNASTSSNHGKESEKEDPPTMKLIEASMETSLKTNKDLKDNDTSQLNLHKSELQLSYKEADTKDPSTISENINYTDEFVNINILDNPDFLKNINQFYDLSCPKSNLCSNDKNSDSDIEILENIESACKDSAELSKIKVDDKLETQIDKDNEDDSNAEISKEIEKIENSPICSKQESSDLSIEEDSLKKLINYPLTLEDIKDTGFSGEDLYKCGNEPCTFKSPNATLLRAHLKECSHNENKNISCAHCGKRFLKVGFLLEHLKIHGIKRFGCSLCDNRFSLSYQAISHIKSRHKFMSHKLIPADPKNPSADGLFIIQPDKSIEDKKRKKKKAKLDDKNSEKKEDVEKSSFSPDEIEQLPRQAIYNREVQCAVCPYTTKVRTNIIRHLQLHAKDETVPESGPVNPVPCLDKKERMFDKMVNLASSSHQNGRMGAKPKEPVVNIIEEDTIPKFVPEHKRYVCGVAECNYLTVDEAMLRYHLKALHSEEPYFRCPHCPSPTPGQEGQNIAIDKMGIHLKMHDARLYKCSHCNHHHYHRHVVERHLADKHPEKRPFVKVIRELENTENIQQFPERDENEEEVPDPDGNHWKCNICDYKCVYKAEMVSHISTSHDEKCQFKCTLCPFKTSGKIIFDQHISSKHADNASADYIMVYQRIKGVNKKPAENVEPIVQDEPFDTTPLWRRDMPRIRHIRGILLEDENLTSETSKSNKRKMEEQGSGRPAKIKASKSASLDENKQCKEKSKRSLSCDKMPEVFKTDEKEKVQDSDTAATESSDKESDVGKFGPYGKPNGNMYTCTLCNQFKTKYKHDMRDHLYRELNYTRWHCSDCGYLSVSRNALLKHCTKRHDGEIQNQKPLSPNTAIEEWVSTLLAKQTSILKLMNQSAQSPQKTSTAKSSPFKSPVKSPKLGALSLQENKIANIKLDLEKQLEDYDSKEDDELIMDLPEEELTDESGKGSTSAISKDEQEKSLECKHCSMKFTSWRGFKLHVQITHLKRLGFLCPYCDRSTNSEHLMRQHIKSKHSGQPEIIVHNPAAGGPELTNEFWEKEYGIVCPKRTRKRKRKQSLSEIREDNSDAIKEEDTTEKCTICGFAALSPGGLKAHMRIHIVKDLGCTQCTYSTSSKAELYEHWEQNHPHLLLKEEVTAVPKKSHLEDYSNDIEVEIIQSTSSSEVENKLFYNCFYCNLRSERLHILEQHWRITHQKSDLPFKYKKVQVPFPKLIKSDDNNALRAYMQSSVANKNNQQVGWMCQWCKEFCDSEIKINSHHNMFHSHLPPKFKKIGSEVGSTPNLFICKYCDKPFKSAGLLISHNTKEHPGNELRLFAQNLNSEIENATGKEVRSTVGETAKAKNEMRRVARKSTTKSNIKYKFKSVARKSTNSLPRYQANKFKVDKKMEIDAVSNDDDDNDEDNDDDDDSDNNKQFSFYGKPIEKVNLAKLNTYMVIGGHRMKVNCTTLTQFMNIHPKLKIPDLKYDAQYAAVLKTI